jgi:flagellar L-ring protein FlgH
MPINKFKSDVLGSCTRRRGQAVLGLTFGLPLGLLALAPVAGLARERAVFSPALPPSIATPVANGAIFQGAYAPLTSGARASQTGDILTITLVERISASKSNSANSGRSGSIGITPPASGPFSLFKPADVNMTGDQSFKGKGDAAQSSVLNGELSVTVIAAYPNGTMQVRGEKVLTLNRGDERVQFSGLVRAADIGPDNRIASTRVADARILYFGKGEVARASRQGWMQRFFSKISPF